MKPVPRIGIIGGKGWLGGAIARSGLASGAMHPERLILSGRSDNEPDGFDGVRFTRDNADLVEHSDVILLSVRPDQFPAINIHAAGKLVISVMAAVPAQLIAARTGALQIVRAMPNAASSIGKSFTPWFAVPPVTPDSKQIVQAIFEACGDAVEVPLEAHVDYCAGMTGTGAAFPALLADALVAHAVSSGLPREFARRAALGVVAGASQLLAEDAADAAAIVREMIDYRGVTAAALETMLDRGFKEIVAAGIDAAMAKSAEMAGG